MASIENPPKLSVLKTLETPRLKVEILSSGQARHILLSDKGETPIGAAQLPNRKEFVRVTDLKDIKPGDIIDVRYLREDLRSKGYSRVIVKDSVHKGKIIAEGAGKNGLVVQKIEDIFKDATFSPEDNKWTSKGGSRGPIEIFVLRSKTNLTDQADEKQRNDVSAGTTESLGKKRDSSEPSKYRGAPLTWEEINIGHAKIQQIDRYANEKNRLTEALAVRTAEVTANEPKKEGLWKSIVSFVAPKTTEAIQKYWGEERQTLEKDKVHIQKALVAIDYFQEKVRLHREGVVKMDSQEWKVLIDITHKIISPVFRAGGKGIDDFIRRESLNDLTARLGK